MFRAGRTRVHNPMIIQVFLFRNGLIAEIPLEILLD